MNGHRLDLARLALANGANPNVTQQYGETPLSLVAPGYDENSVKAVDMLVKAGADVNLLAEGLPPYGRRPVWRAVDYLSQFHVQTCTSPSLQTLKQLVAAGADLNLPDKEGRPPIWFLLTPVRGHPEEVDPSERLVELLPLLVHLGMNPNATWKGETIYPLVERKLGRGAPTAIVLRELGAH